MKAFRFTTALMWLCVTACLSAQTLPAHLPKLSPDQIQQWRQDLAALKVQMRARHMNLHHTLSASVFDAQLVELEQRLPELNEAQILVALMRLSTSVGDGHTQINYWGTEYHRLPFKFRMFGDQLRVVATSQRHVSLMGARLTHLAGVPESRVRELLRGHLPSVENDLSWMSAYAGTVGVAEVLYGLGIAPALNPVQAEFNTLAGERVRLWLAPVSAADFAAVQWSEPDWRDYGFVDSGIGAPGIALLVNADLSAAYIQFDSYPDFNIMRTFVERVHDRLAADGVRRVIIDLRNNHGGDFFVGLLLAHGLVLLDQLDWARGVFVLTGRHTYSAAMSNAAQFRQILHARLVGEATGANPVGYQDADAFELPNAGWQAIVSKRYYRFQSEFTEGVQPDQSVHWPLTDYLAGDDVPLAWILAQFGE